MRRLVLLLTILACLAVPAALAKGSFPETIALPNGFAARGDRDRQGHTFYVGSIPTGAVYGGDLRTGDGQRARPGRDRPRGDRAEVRPRPALGLRRGDRQGVRLRRRDRRALREYQLATERGPDVHQRRRRHEAGRVLHRLEPRRCSTGSRSAGTARPATDHDRRSAATTSTLPGFNLNGIDATPNGKTLLAVQTATRASSSRSTRRPARRSAIDLGGATLTNGDGILLHGEDALRRAEPAEQDRRREAAPRLTRGVVTRTITDSDFDVPTTIDRSATWLYAVNARFGTAPAPDATIRSSRCAARTYLERGMRGASSAAEARGIQLCG